MLTHQRIDRSHDVDDHHHLTKINHYTVTPRLRLRPSLNALVAMLVAMRLERLRPSPKSILSPRLRILRVCGLRGLQIEYVLCLAEVSRLIVIVI